MTFPERLKQLRKEKGITQTDLANALDISGGTVAMWETGKRRPSFELLMDLAEYFNRSADYILGNSDVPTAFSLDEGEVETFGMWVVQEEYEDVMRKFAMLDEYGKRAVQNILRAEFARCQDQGTLISGNGLSVVIKTKKVSDPINEELPD